MLISILAAVAATALPGPDLSWMAGNWVSCAPQEVAEERWLGLSSGTLVGVNTTRTPKDETFEFLRIGREGKGVAYVARPGGGAPVAFPLVEAREGYARFENMDHDFPKRIVYRREGEALFAAATDENDKGPSWRFRRGEASACPALTPPPA